MVYLPSFLLNGSSAAMQLITSSKTGSHSSLLPLNCCCSAILLSGWLSAMASLKCFGGFFWLDGWRDLLTETESQMQEFTSNSHHFNHKLPESLEEWFDCLYVWNVFCEVELKGTFWINKTITITLNIHDIVYLPPPLYAEDNFCVFCHHGLRRRENVKKKKRKKNDSKAALLKIN